MKKLMEDKSEFKLLIRDQAVAEAMAVDEEATAVVVEEATVEMIEDTAEVVVVAAMEVVAMEVAEVVAVVAVEDTEDEKETFDQRVCYILSTLLNIK